MGDRSWRGTWWEAGKADAECPGTLYYADDGGLRLELIGGFDTQIRTPLPGGGGDAVSMESRDFPIIHGVAGGDRFTLLNNHATHTSGGFLSPDIVKQDWTSNRALRGIHLRDEEEKVFTQGHVRLERLLHWSNRSTLDLALVVENGKPTGEQKVGTHKEPSTVVSHGDFQISLRIQGSEFNLAHKPIANTRGLESVEWAALDFEVAEPVSYDAFDTVDKDMQDLLTLSAYAACGSHGQSLVYETSETHPGSANFPNEVEVMGQQIFRTDAQVSEKAHHKYLFTLEDLDFPVLVPRWLSLKETARMGCNILFGLRYISQGYVGTRLLGVASAAENLHRSLRPSNTPLPKKQYTDLKKKLLDAVADEPDEVQGFVNEGLRNIPTYRERMLDLASIPDAEAVDRLLTNRAAWAAMLTRARNDMAHANERATPEAELAPAFWLLEVTYALLCLVLMAEMGLSAETQRAALDHPQIGWALHQFRKAVS